MCHAHLDPRFAHRDAAARVAPLARAREAGKQTGPAGPGPFGRLVARLVGAVALRVRKEVGHV
jgi:hypothetical protein